jgi:hypothetical protein
MGSGADLQVPSANERMSARPGATEPARSDHLANPKSG